MSPRLYLHVGTHKTGTTAFQHYMRDHAAAYAARGVVFITQMRDGAVYGNHVDLAHAVLRNDLVTRMRASKEQPFTGVARVASVARSLRAAVRAQPSPAYLISAEALCCARTWAETARLRLMLRIAGLTDIRPVVTFRNPADWRASWQAELAKYDRPGTTLRYGTGTGDIRGPWYYDTAAIRTFWQRIGPLTEVDYDAARAGPGVVPAVLDAIGQEPLDSHVADYIRNTRRC